MTGVAEKLSASLQLLSEDGTSRLLVSSYCCGSGALLYASVCPVLLTRTVKPSDLVSLHASVKIAPTVPTTCAILKLHKGTLIFPS